MINDDTRFPTDTVPSDGINDIAGSATIIHDDITNPIKTFTDEMLRDRLLNEMRNIRKEQYEVLCYSNACDMYSATAEGLANMATGKKRPDSNDVLAHPEQYSKLSSRSDSVFNIVKENPQIKITRNPEACCAYSAMNIVNATCAEMGYAQGSVITPDKEGKNPYVSSAQYCHLFLDEGKHKIEGSKEKRTVPELIASGELGAGSIVSYRSNHGAGSGYHAVTIAEVKRDKNGNVVGYTVQQNNGRCEAKMEYFELKKDENGKIISENPFKGLSKDGTDYFATPINKLVDKEIDREIENMKNMSPAEIEKILESRKKELEQQKIRLKQNEKTMLNNPLVQRWNEKNNGASMTVEPNNFYSTRYKREDALKARLQANGNVKPQVAENAKRMAESVKRGTESAKPRAAENNEKPLLQRLKADATKAKAFVAKKVAAVTQLFSGKDNNKPQSKPAKVSAVVKKAQQKNAGR